MNERPDFKQTAHRWYERLNGPLGFALTVIGIATLYFGVIDWRVRSIVNDPDFVATVARRIRPAMVFDSRAKRAFQRGRTNEWRLVNA